MADKPIIDNRITDAMQKAGKSAIAQSNVSSGLVSYILTYVLVFAGNSIISILGGSYSLLKPRLMPYFSAPEAIGEAVEFEVVEEAVVGLSEEDAIMLSLLMKKSLSDSGVSPEEEAVMLDLLLKKSGRS